MALLATVHLARRLNQTVLVPAQVFRSSDEIFRHFQAKVEGLKKECLWALLLDGKNRLAGIVKISEGSLTTSMVHPREAFRPAVQEAAAGILFVHNHPSGDPAPSQEDVQITRRLVETGRILGIRVLDHVIIGAFSYFSFADQGML
jgi:DNA repair protein RadC